MTTTLPNILLNPGVVAASHGKAVINDKTANDQDFMTLLNQSLPGGFGLDEGQLLQLLPEQTAGRDLSPAGQLLALSDSQSVALSDDTLMELTQLLSQFKQIINQEHTGHLSATGGKNSAVQSENGQTKPLSAEETAALNALLVMLSQQPVHSHSPALSVLDAGNPLADASQQKVQLTDPALSMSGALNGEMVNGLVNASAIRTVDAKTSGGNKYDRDPVLNSVTERHKTSGLKPADVTESANNVVLPITASTRATEVDIARRDPAVLAAHNMSMGIAGESHTATGNVSMPPAGSHGALIQAQLGSPQWQQAISQQIMLFSRNGQHNAELRLHPAELGSVKISLKLDDNLASLQMISPHSHVRAALEAALPVLRTQLAESGIQLGQSNISSESFTGQQQGQQQSPPSPGRNFVAGSGDDSLVVPASLVSLARSDGAIDTFV